jgi:hypothetical protein
MENKIIFTTVDNIKESDVDILKQNGVIVIQVKDLMALKTVNEIDNDIVLECAMESINESIGSEKNKFFNKFFVKYFKDKNKDGKIISS